MKKLIGLDACVSMLMTDRKRECSLCKKPVTGEFFALVTIHYAADAEPDCVFGIDILCMNCRERAK